LGVEYAANPKALGYVDKSEVESNDKFLRIGIARTDIQRLASEYGERFGTDYWKDKDKKRLTLEMENVRNMTKRLEKAYTAFGDRIKYAGPDCGLGSWPDQESAYFLLKNAAKAVSEFNSSDQ
jgi:5-methyltetrahydropteroyltriglutamate--homocysteine methyltransferase